MWTGGLQTGPRLQLLWGNKAGLLVPPTASSRCPTFPLPLSQVGPLCNGQVCPYANAVALTANGQIPYVKRPEDSTEYNNMVRRGRGGGAGGSCLVHAGE